MAPQTKPSEATKSPESTSTMSVRGLARPVTEIGLLSVVVLVVAYLTLRLWRIPFGLALQYGGDELAGLAHVKGVDENGWWFTNPRLGAPFGQEHYDFPHGGETLQVALVRTLGLVSDAPAAIMNAYLLVTFVLVAASAYLVLRYLRFEAPVAGLVAMLYTFLPFHYAHLTPHIYRSGYFAAPLAALALLWLAGYDGGLMTSTGPRWRDVEIRGRRVLVVGIAIVLVATTDVVAAAFAPAIAGMIGVLGVLRQRAFRTLGLVMVFSAATMILVVLVNTPTLVYRYQNGANTETVQRQLPEQEAWGLKISRVVLPSPQHPIDFLAEQGTKPTISPIRSEGGQALGLIGVAGLIGGIVAALPLGVGVERARARVDGDEDQRQAQDQDQALDRGHDNQEGKRDRGELLRLCGLLMIVILLLAVPSGLAYLASLIGFEEIRTWNRIVVYLGFFALVSAGIGLERFGGWARRHGAAPWMVTVALAGVGVLGVLDQAPGTRFNYEPRIAGWNRDAHFFAMVEDELAITAEDIGEAPMVYQLPLVAYPEPARGLLAYDHFRGYLHTDEVAWSHGAMRGRDAWHWQLEWSQWPLQARLDGLAAAGFDGIYVDKIGYEDGGAALTAELGVPATLEDERQLYYTLEEASDRLGDGWSDADIDQLADEVLEPARAVLGPGFHGTTMFQEAEGGVFATDDASFELSIADGAPRQVTLVIELATGPGGGHSVVLTRADGGEVLAEGVSSPLTRELRFELDVEIPAGGLELRLTTDSPSFQAPGDPRQINLHATSIQATGPALERLLAQHGLPVEGPDPGLE
jgi:phosphoglycerol transferase